MATTTNYGWTTPDDTALVKDGASAIRTLGSSVDTTVKALNPGTTAGDLDYYTAATTKARIAKGTAGQVFTMNSGATAPEWATPSSGGMTLISTTSLTGASITLSSIPQTYNKLYIEIKNFQPATDGAFLLMRYNNISTSTYREASPDVTSATYSKAFNDNIGGSSSFLKSDNTTVLGFGFIEILDYTNTTTNKLAILQGFSTDSTTTTDWRVSGSTGTSTATTAISSLVFLPSSGNFTSGSILLYGVK